jgi:3-oxoacyl-[acyl-carrier protein] reductase
MVNSPPVTLADGAAAEVGSGRLAGRRAIVTGGARGIGAAIAAAYRSEGAAVAIIDRDAEGLGPTAERLGAAAIVGDLGDPESAVDATRQAVAALGGVDVLVNNAGVLRFATVLETTVDEWDLMFDVNARSMLLTTQVAVPFMMAAGGGRIVNMASMGGKLGAPGQAHYCASKAAVIAFTRVCAMEFGPHAINVNCLCPGYVLTEMGAATRTAEKVAAWSEKSPLGRLGEPEDVARMAVFLASVDSSYCTGQAFNVTGGMIMS